MSLERYSVARWILEHALRSLVPLPDSIALFGSFSRDDLHKESDVDLLLVGDGIPVKPYDRSKWVHPLLNAWREEGPSQEKKRPLSPLILSRKGWVESVGLRLSLSEHLWILYDDGLLSSTLSETRDWIRQGLWDRRPSRDGGWLWVPKQPSKGAA